MNNENDKLYRNGTEPVSGTPETCDEVINKYGTYEVQDTADSDNDFPKIAQGLPKKRQEKNYKGFKNRERES